MTSGSLWRGAAGAARDDPAAPAKRTRKSEPGLLKYALRALAKTSPFSRYTAVAIGWWQDGGGQRFDVQADAVTSYIEPGHLAIRRLLRVAAGHQDSLRRCTYRLARAARVEGDRLAFEVDVDLNVDPVGRLAQPARGHDASAPGRGRTRRGGTRGRRTAAISTAWWPWRPAVDPAPERLARAQAFVDKLITLHLLVPSDDVPKQTGDILGRARQALIQLGSRRPSRRHRTWRPRRSRWPSWPPLPRNAGWPCSTACVRSVHSAYRRFDAEPVDLTSSRTPPEQAGQPGRDRVAAGADGPGRAGAAAQAVRHHDLLRALFVREFVARYGPGGSNGDVYGFARLVPTSWSRGPGWTG